MTLPIILSKTFILSNSFLSSIQKPVFAFKDALDILVVAVLIFFLLALLRKTGSLPIFLGIILLGVVYAVSLALNLRLAQNIFSAFFGAIFIMLAIVFQKELRRFLAMIGLFGFKRKVFAPTESPIRIASQAIQNLAKQRLGALLVFPGQENIYRHIEGGVRLNGKISLPLLLSIFDNSSPGHDGAVIIENDIVRKFGAHLPMAEDIEAVKKFGTRHRAALGIAEKTDAFCVVVSEEKGTISTAYNKKLSVVLDASDLENRLKDFFERSFPQKNWLSYRKWLKENWAYAIASLFIAFFFWLFFTYQTSVVQRNFTIPVEFKNLNPEYIVAESDPEKILAILSGQENDFRLLSKPNQKALKSIL